MPQFSFPQDNTVNTPKKILDVSQYERAYVTLQVLDASVLHYAKNRETLIDTGQGAAAPNSVQGLQIKAANGPVSFWMSGELWGSSDTPQGLIEVEVMYEEKKHGGGGCGCGGGCGGGKNPAEIA
jgi:hypothetical protein